MNKLNSGFSKLNDTQFDNKVDHIITSLTGNAKFPAPTPTIPIVQGLLDDYRAALALDPGPARTTAVTATRFKLQDAVDKLARNLELTANVTDAMLATSGYDLRKDPTFTDELVAPPGNVRLKSLGVSGTVHLMCAAVERAKAYELQSALDPEPADWTDRGTFPSTRGISVTDLERGKDIWMRIRAVGPSGAGAWSDPATTMVT